MSLLGRLAAVFGRATGVYVAGAVAVLAVGFVNTIVVARYLEPSGFGRLALFLAVATLVTLVCNLGTLQGALIFVYGSAGEDEGGEEELGGEPIPDLDRQAALTTALLVTLIEGGVFVLAATADPSGLASHLTGRSGEGTELLLAVASGGLGASWRLALNVVRMEQRAGLFSSLGALRAAVALALSWALLAAGEGVAGVLLALVLANALVMAVTLLLSLRSFALRASISYVPGMLRVGARYIPITISSWVVHSGDVLLLSRYVSDATVGQFRLGARYGAFQSYFVSSFLLAWSPIARSSLFAAAQHHHHREMRVSMIRFYWLISITVAVAVSLAAPFMVRLAGEDFSEAAKFVPVIAGGYVVYGLFIILYRLAEFPRKRWVYPLLAVVAAFLFVAIAVVATPRIGPMGTAMAPMIAYLILAIAIRVLDLRGPRPLPLELGPIALATVLGVGCIGAGFGLAELVPGSGGLIELAAIPLFPLFAIATGLVTTDQLRTLARAAVMGARSPRGEVDDYELELIDADDRALLDACVASKRTPLAEIEARFGLSEPELRMRVVWALRVASGLEGATPLDAQIGEYLVTRVAVADRYALARTLISQGVDPLELDRLEGALAAAGKAR